MPNPEEIPPAQAQAAPPEAGPADDQLEIEIDPDLEEYIHTQKLILAASSLDIEALRDALDVAGANVRDPETLLTPLHAVIQALILEEDDDLAKTDADKSAPVDGPKPTPGAQSDSQPPRVDTDKVPLATEMVQLLLENGAVWDDLDANGETAGCFANRLGLDDIYEKLVEAGFRAELLLRLQGYFMLGSDDDDDEQQENQQQEQEQPDGETVKDTPQPDTETEQQEGDPADPLSNDGYLSKPLPSTLPSGDLIDADSNAVMMSWETPIMEAHAAALLPLPGRRILNIGHGMGIFDGIVRDSHFPSAHHIIEAHPTVLERMGQAGWATGTHRYPSSAPAAAPAAADIAVHAGTWQAQVPKLVEAIGAGQLAPFDAVYYDTFAESYDSFRELARLVPDLLGGPRPDAAFGFFFGSGADRQVCYDVYTRIAEMDMHRLGFKTEWKDIEIEDLEAKGVWTDVARPYWNIKTYRMPTCTFSLTKEDDLQTHTTLLV